MNRILYYIGCVLIGAGTAIAGFPVYKAGVFSIRNLLVLFGILSLWMMLDMAISSKEE